MWDFGGCFAPAEDALDRPKFERRADSENVSGSRVGGAAGAIRQPHRMRRGSSRGNLTIDFARLEFCPTVPGRKREPECCSVGASAPAAAALARRVAVAAIHRAIAAGLKRHRRRLSACRTNDGSSLGGSGTVTRTTLIVFLGLPARLAAFRRRVTAFLKERLIGSGEGEVLPTVAAG
jgi:hypothetical protein